jgi:DNA-binding NarL/FixJ family response regulator
MAHRQALGAPDGGAVRTVGAGAGGSLLDARTTTALLDRIRRERGEADPLAALTEQERDVFDLIGEGLTNRQIGERVFLAEKTVTNYVSKVPAKLQVERRTQAAVLASQLRKDKRRPRE